MKQILWSKTILSCYRYFERIVMSLDKLVIKEAMGSISSNSLVYTMKSAESISNKILDYTEKKIALINAKVLTEKALYSMDRDLAKILIKKYLQSKKPEEIASSMSISRRTFYRKLDSAIKTFAHQILMLGFNGEKLDKMLGDQKWIMKIYSNFQMEELDKNSIENVEILPVENIFLQNVYKCNKVSLFN